MKILVRNLIYEWIEVSPIKSDLYRCYNNLSDSYLCFPSVHLGENDLFLIHCQWFRIAMINISPCNAIYNIAWSPYLGNSPWFRGIFISFPNKTLHWGKEKGSRFTITCVISKRCLLLLPVFQEASWPGKTTVNTASARKEFLVRHRFQIRANDCHENSAYRFKNESRYLGQTQT